MKNRWKIFWLLLAIPFGLAALNLLLAHHRAGNAVEEYKAWLRGRGEKLEIAELLPPVTPPAQNGASLVRSAFGYSASDYSNIPPAMSMIAPGRAMVGWQQPEVRDLSDNFTNSWENVLAANTTHQPAIEALVQASIYPVLDFQLDYQKGLDRMVPPQLESLRSCAWQLDTAAMVDLHQWNPAAAATNICAVLALVHGMEGEWVAISQYARTVMASLAVADTWEWLQCTNLSEVQLAGLQKSWERVTFIEPMEKAMAMERAQTEATIQKIRSSRVEFDHISGISSFVGSPPASDDWRKSFQYYAQTATRKWRETLNYYIWRNSWAYPDELSALKKFQSTLETLRLIETNQQFQPAYDKLVRLVETRYASSSRINFEGNGDLQNLFSQSTMYFGGVRQTMDAEAAKQMVLAAIELQRYKLKHGSYPVQLAELVPEFAAAIPPDPVDGHPLRYRRNADGTYLLYSIGEDGVDNGGDPTSPSAGHNFSWQGNQVRDWVWPQPATAAEIQDYFDHPPK